MNNLIKDQLVDSEKLIGQFYSQNNNIDLIFRAAESMIKTYTHSAKIISCGNGGSMADSMHFAEELSGKFLKDRKSLPAISISDPAYISCTANDYGYDHIFSRYISSMANENDTLLAISTSGNSQNVINGVIEAKKIGMNTIGLLGKDGGELKKLVDTAIIIPSQKPHRIQELHIKIIHIFIELIERHFFPQNYK